MTPNRPLKCVCARRDADSFLVNALHEASKSLMEQRGALATIRNGGWEHAFRNRILEVTEKFRNVIGFAEARVERVSRIDMAYLCRKCGGCVLVAETKSNFATQPRDIKDRPLDACLQLERLARIGLPTYLVYALIEQTWYDRQSRLVSVHNSSLPRSCSYKRFIETAAEDLRPTHLFAKDAPVTTKERRFAPNRVRVSVRVWLARCAPGDRTGDMSLTFINGKAESGARRLVPGRALADRRKLRPDHKPTTPPP